MHNSLINKNKAFADIEELCSFMIKEHYGSSKDFKSVDITDFIINVLGYQILYESFDGPDADAEGFTSDGKQTVYLNRNGIVELVLFPPGFIIIDKVFLQDKYKARGRFVLAHEAGHVISDKLYHSGTAGYVRDMGELSDKEYEKIVSSMSLREIRANRCGAALLMPDFLFIESLKRHHITKKQIYNAVEIIDLICWTIAFPVAAVLENRTFMQVSPMLSIVPLAITLVLNIAVIRSKKKDAEFEVQA